LKAKNVKLYQEKFSHLSDDIFERVMDFVSSKKFNKNDKKKFFDEVNKYKDKKPDKIKIILDIIPEQTPRPRFTMKGKRVYVENSKDNNDYIKHLAYHDCQEIYGLIQTACKFKCDCYLPIPEGWNKVDKLLAELGIKRPTSTPDWDNLGKTYSDMIQPWILNNDSFIVDGECHKYYSMKPRVEITLEY
jgi:Holliday junction resolvase RusA-like endonuclease